MIYDGVLNAGRYKYMENKIPNPGSNEALKQGCLCAVLDNTHGKGAYNGKPGTFWITEDCPLHGKGSAQK
jgi:hypothetical protein